MTYRVQLSDEARMQLLDIDAWWTNNRSGAADLIMEEFARAVTLLESMPLAGKAYLHSTSSSYRRLL